MRVARIIALGLICLVIGAAGGLVYFQRSLIYWPQPPSAASPPAGIDIVHITTADGEDLVGWHHRAQAGQPTFLFFDGNGGKPQIQSGRWRRLMDHGAGFLAVYYRGYAGSTGHPTEAGLHIDARAGYDWLIAHGLTPHDIVLHGFSLGTGVAIKLATERPARAMVLEAPYTSVVDLIQTRLPIVPAFLVSDPFPSREWIASVHIPVLFVHGDRDSVIPYTQARQLFARANEPREFVTLSGSDHCTLVRDGLYDEIWAFLRNVPSFAIQGAALSP